MFGLGRVGELPQEISIEAFVEQVKEAFQLDGLRIVQPKMQILCEAHCDLRWKR